MSTDGEAPRAPGTPNFEVAEQGTVELAKLTATFMKTMVAEGVPGTMALHAAEEWFKWLMYLNRR